MLAALPLPEKVVEAITVESDNSWGKVGSARIAPPRDTRRWLTRGQPASIRNAALHHRRTGVRREMRWGSFAPPYREPRLGAVLAQNVVTGDGRCGHVALRVRVSKAAPGEVAPPVSLRTDAGSPGRGWVRWAARGQGGQGFREGSGKNQ